MHPMLNIAINAAREAGTIMTYAFDRLDQIDVKEKSKNNYVTDIDVAVERRVIEILKKAYPDHSILAEESGETDSSSHQWIIDPIDGTMNFMHGFPHFCISIALMVDGKVEQGVIYDPIRQDLFSATRGRGAQLNNAKIRVSTQHELDKALLASCRRSEISCGAFRCTGSAALDLAYVAAGKLDGYFENNLKIWDMAAGALMVKEAGGFVSDVDGSENYLQSGKIVAANPKLFKSLLKNI